MGIDYRTFKHLNPTKLKAYNKAYEMKLERDMQMNDSIAWMNGVYISKAIGVYFKGKYPDKPMQLFKTKVEEKELTEEEIQKEREKLILSLQIMQTNFELNHK